MQSKMRSAGAPMRRASSSVEISAADWAMSLSRGWEERENRERRNAPSVSAPAPRSERRERLDRLLRQRRNGDGAAGRPGRRERPAAVEGWPTSGWRAAGLVFLALVVVLSRWASAPGRRLGVELQAGAARGGALQRLAVGGRAGLGLGGRHRGRRRRFSWAKEGAAKATAARAAMLAIKRRIGTSPGPLAMGGRCGLDILAKCYGICVIYVKFLIVYSN